VFYFPPTCVWITFLLEDMGMWLPSLFALNKHKSGDASWGPLHFSSLCLGCFSPRCLHGLVSVFRPLLTCHLFNRAFVDHLIWNYTATHKTLSGLQKKRKKPLSGLQSTYDLTYQICCLLCLLSPPPPPSEFKFHKGRDICFYCIISSSQTQNRHLRNIY